MSGVTCHVSRRGGVGRGCRHFAKTSQQISWSFIKLLGLYQCTTQANKQSIQICTISVMSVPPQYQRIPIDDVEAPPAWSKGNPPPSSDDEPAYPPRPSVPTSSTEPVKSVTYTFEPQWPMKGQSEDVIGIMGRDREASRLRSETLFPFRSVLTNWRL